ncbi:MAG: hypothetical protein WA111_10555, partial [Methanothrix sp.]
EKWPQMDYRFFFESEQCKDRRELEAMHFQYNILIDPPALICRVVLYGIQGVCEITAISGHYRIRSRSPFFSAFIPWHC